jgi:hypothetical protein
MILVHGTRISHLMHHDHGNDPAPKIKPAR